MDYFTMQINIETEREALREKLEQLVHDLGLEPPSIEGHAAMLYVCKIIKVTNRPEKPTEPQFTVFIDFDRDEFASEEEFNKFRDKHRKQLARGTFSTCVDMLKNVSKEDPGKSKEDLEP